jgi:5-carboxymethyl-2-hydroxymuconate isomerase
MFSRGRVNAPPITEPGEDQRMPHIIVEYSANLERSLDVQKLVGDLHQVVVDSGIADIAAIRTRAERRDAYRIADGDAKNAFVHILARFRKGRSADVLTRTSEALLAATDKNLAHAFATHAIAVTVEIEEIDNITARKNTIRKVPAAS